MTSLSQQLKQLATPQTSQLVDKTSKRSLLFDFKEAANINRDTFYSIGLTGLKELEEVNPIFNRYERTLFDSASINFVRSVESSKKNEKLDNEINRFLIHCSPYFLLNPTFKALEWLVNRYLIQEFNVDSLMMLALPYYGTNSFAQVVQLINVKKHPSWAWLLPIKKQGTPLSKTALFNRAAVDITFFKFVCNMPLLAVEVYQKNQGNCLANLFTFYCTTIIGAFEHSAIISELYVSHLLPSLTSGLSSCVIDYVASSYMILSCLVAKVQLGSMIVQRLFAKVVQVELKEMRIEAVVLMVILSQCDRAISENSLRLLIKTDWFLKCVAKVAKSGVVVFPLVADMLSTCIDVINGEKAQLTEAKALIINILSRMQFSDEEAEQVFRLLIDSCAEKKNASLNWMVKLLQSLEKQYPRSFDIVISDSKYSEITKQIIGLGADYKGQSDLFEKLHHPNPIIRTTAIKAVPNQMEPVKFSWLSETMLERMSDESPQVVMAVVNLPCNYLESLIGREELINCLINLGNKLWCMRDDNKWTQLAPKVFSRLGELVNSDFCELTLLRTVIPFLFGSETYPIEAAKTILTSKLYFFNQFLKSVYKRINPEHLNDSVLKKAVWHSLFDPFSFSLQIDEDIIQACYPASSIHKFITILFASAALPSNSDPVRSANLVRLVERLVKESELMYDNRRQLGAKTISKIVNRCRKEKLPLEIVEYFLCKVIQYTNVNVDKVNCWWDLNDASQVFLYSIFKFCLDINKSFVNPHFNEFFGRITTQFYLKFHFHSSEDYCKLLCNIIAMNPDIAFECLNELKSHITKLDRKELIWAVELHSSNFIVPTLLIEMCSKVEVVRELAFEIMIYIYTAEINVMSPFVPFMKELIEWKEEILCDSDQTFVAMYMLLSPDPAVQSGHPETFKQEMSKVCNTLFSIAVDRNPSHVVASLLQLLVFVNSVDIMKKLIPLAVEILGQQNISEDQNIIVESVIKKIEQSVVSVFEDDEMWNLTEKCLKLHSTQILIGTDKKPPAVLFLKKITQAIFDELTESGKCKLIDLAVAMNADSENGEANIAAVGMIKKIVLDSSCILPILASMKDVNVLPPNALKRRKSWNRAPSLDIMRTVDWRKGISLLELIQNKKKITNIQSVLPVLFDILKRCLEFEEQAPVEYAKQLVLSAVLHFCQKLSEEGELHKIPMHIIPVELIVQSIRASQNPQTHHHALLVLVEVAALVPEKVLHDIMPIFTFVGSSILRMDDSYSFQIILKIIETVIPILVKNIKGKEDLFSIQQVLQVFVDALLDIPEHRRLTLILKLISTLDSEGSYLWLFICLVAQSEVLTVDTAKFQTESVSKSYEQGKLKVLKNLCLEFPAIALINTMYHVMKHVASLPHDKDGKCASKRKKSGEPAVSIFDVEKNSGKQLRHYKYILINFISSFLALPSFIDMVLVQNNDDVDGILVLSFKSLVHEVLDYLQAVTKQVKNSNNQPSSKYWKAMQHLVEDIHGKVNAVLPNTIFLNMMRSILSSENCPAKIQRKMLEIFNWRLQSTNLEEDGLVALVPVILLLVKGDTSAGTDAQIAQQAAFISLKLLARQIATSYPAEFEKALECVTVVVKKGLLAKACEGSDIVLASAVLCLAEMVATLGSKAIQFLPKFMPAVIQTISRARSDPDVPEVLLLSVVTTVQKVLENHTLFINPYLDSIFIELCLISSSYNEKNSQKSIVITKLDTIRQTFSEKLELRVLLPAVESSYAQLLELEEYGAIVYLMLLLSDSLTGLNNWKDLQEFLIECLDFRQEVADPKAVSIVEPAVISCTVSMVLKMNEKEFRGFYSVINKWISVLSDNKAREQVKMRAIPFYNLCGSLAETLKSIFVPYVKDFLKNAANLLEKCNAGKLEHKQLFLYNGKTGVKNTKELVKSILNVFLTVFRYDNENFINEDRFNIIMKPLVNQLESEFCINDDTLDKLLAPCLAHMATSISDDSLWKKYNYEILLKTQHESVKVRLAAIKTVCELAKKLGDSYLPLLPETIPYLSELLEDEDEVVEKACRSVVQDLESILGEEISKFF